MEYFYKEFFIKKTTDYFYLFSDEFGNGFRFSNWQVDVQFCEEYGERIDICLDCFGLDTFIFTDVSFLEIWDNIKFRAVVTEKDIEYLFS